MKIWWLLILLLCLPSISAFGVGLSPMTSTVKVVNYTDFGVVVDRTLSIRNDNNFSVVVFLQGEIISRDNVILLQPNESKIINYMIVKRNDLGKPFGVGVMFKDFNNKSMANTAVTQFEIVNKSEVIDFVNDSISVKKGKVLSIPVRFNNPFSEKVKIFLKSLDGNVSVNMSSIEVDANNFGIADIAFKSDDYFDSNMSLDFVLKTSMGEYQVKHILSVDVKENKDCLMGLVVGLGIVLVLLCIAVLVYGRDDEKEVSDGQGKNS